MADNTTITAGAGTTIATDERTIASTAVHVQRVDEQGSQTTVAGQTTITNSSSAIAAARDTRKRIVMVNRQTVSVYVTSETATTGKFRLDPGESLTLYTTAAVNGITSAAYTASGDAKVHYIEEYD
jgi:CRISPR/Cas system CMR subunit Cmr4 (Cas7 group RAMP superfamily)